MAASIKFEIFALVFLTGVVVLTASDGTRLSDIIFVVLSQPNPYHVGRARELQIHFMEQLEGMDNEDKPALYLTHKKWPVLGSWTIFPLLTEWAEKFPHGKWMFVCEDETRIDLQKLVTVLQRFNPVKDLFLGHALRDKEHTIIHHFTSPKKLTFPDFAAGFLLTFPLIKKLAARWPDPDFRSDFAIDPKHELASYILLENVHLTDVPELCSETEDAKCATTYPVKFPDCGPAIDNNDLFVAVKTCEKFHNDRVQVVLKTFSLETPHLEFYSETHNDTIPTIDLGIPNTEKGHCGKTMAIMKRAVTHPHIASRKWLAIVDDDTIMYLQRLRQLLACYDPDGLVALGERYGYQVSKGYGYNYITGGGGMLFSMPVVQQLVDECQCGSIDSPDDMVLGMCLKRLKIPVTHVPYIHQARPDDYSEGYLNRQIPVSFHKHWNCDPYKVYQLLKDYDNSPQTDSEQYSRIGDDEWTRDEL